MRRVVVLVLALAALPVHALDKQGSAHGGSVDGDSGGFNVSGALMLGVAPWNPSYAARPDNSGLTLFRYGAHLDVDLLGRLLSIPIDLSAFTDGTRPGAEAMAPSELDVIAGLTSTVNVGHGAAELGLRVEHDRPVDRGSFTQTYVDARARYLYSLAAYAPGLKDALHHGDVHGWVTLGGFFVNPSYAARPDNTGLALFRYALHTEVSAFDDLVSLGLDGTMFTDRTAPNPVAPSELDFTVDLILHLGAFEVHLAYERDVPVDRGALVQQFVYLLGAWSFDLREVRPPAVTHRNRLPSP